jgi:flagellar basal body-associated protein FliL
MGFEESGSEVGAYFILLLIVIVELMCAYINYAFFHVKNMQTVCICYRKGYARTQISEPVFIV